MIPRGMPRVARWSRPASWRGALPGVDELLALTSAMRRLRRPLLGGALLLLAAWWISDIVAQVVAMGVQRELMDDFRSYYAAGLHVASDAPIYPTFEFAPYPLARAAGGQGFVYSPLAALVSVPLTILPLQPAYAVSTGIFVAAFTVVVLAIVRRAGLTGRRSLLVVLLLVLLNGPVLSNLKTGNWNLLVAAGLGLMWLAPASSGWISVAGGLVKLFPGAGLVWAVRRHAPVAAPLAAGVIAMAGSVAIQGPGPWTDFLVAFRNGQPESWYALQSPAHLFGPLVGYACAGALLLGAWRIRDDAIAFALLSLGMLAPAPDLWSHYLVIAEIGFLPLACRYAIAARTMSHSRASLADPSQELNTATSAT